ncbi:unnamed protein product [Oikopleura dioica]|uniref:Uncharacterized protein n=1 Tax=Oikopleura dioica TaxID=34765 RepID=E4XQD3_OIKDI|nr:unnamed protein product [Oikopleura dioica]
MKAFFVGLVFFAAETVAKREFTAFQLAVKKQRREIAKSISCNDVPVFNEEFDHGLDWHCKSMPRNHHMERGWCRPRCARRRETRTGPKKIWCDKKLGWISKFDSEPIQPDAIFCS